MNLFEHRRSSRPLGTSGLKTLSSTKPKPFSSHPCFVICMEAIPNISTTSSEITIWVAHGQTLLLEKVHVFGDKDKTASFVEAGKDKNNFLQRRSGIDRGLMKNGKEEKNSAGRPAQTAIATRVWISDFAEQK